MQIGFSTGAIYKSGIPLVECLEIFKKLGCSAVELNFIRLTDLLAVDSSSHALKEGLKGFSWVSLHAPTGINYGEWGSRSGEIFEKIGEIHAVRPLDLVVFHPETIYNFAVFKLDSINFLVAFENMDNRKPSYRGVEDFEWLLGQNDKFRFVLDVNHAYTNDKSMQLARNLSTRLGSLLSEIHISGYAGYHEPLYQTEQKEIIEAIPCFDLPIIIEGCLPIELLPTELGYIIETINGLRK